MTILVDSDVLIEVCRGRNESFTSVWRELSLSGVAILYSPVTAAELWGGAFPSEHKLLHSLFQALKCMTIDEEAAARAGDYLRQYRRSHNLGLGDALIAATAVQSGAKLWTRSRKHYPMKGIEFYQP